MQKEYPMLTLRTKWIALLSFCWQVKQIKNVQRPMFLEALSTYSWTIITVIWSHHMQILLLTLSLFKVLLLPGGNKEFITVPQSNLPISAEAIFPASTNQTPYRFVTNITSNFYLFCVDFLDWKSPIPAPMIIMHQLDRMFGHQKKN